VDVIDLNVPCVQTNEIDGGLSAPSAGFTSSIVMDAPIEVISDENGTSGCIFESDLDDIKLVKNNEVMARICHTKSLFSVMMDAPMTLSHARDKISEIPCLRVFIILIFNSVLLEIMG
jgi:hypothetical protein